MIEMKDTSFNCENQSEWSMLQTFKKTIFAIKRFMVQSVDLTILIQFEKVSLVSLRLLNRATRECVIM